MMPVIPGLTDDPAAIENVVRGGAPRGRIGGLVALAVPQTLGGPPLHPVHQGALSRDGGPYRRVLRPRGVCAARLRRRLGAIFDRMRANYGFTMDHERYIGATPAQSAAAAARD